MTTKTKAPTPPTALETEAECLAMILRAEIAAGKSTSAGVAAEQEVREAKQALENAHDARIRGEDNADEQMRAALTRLGTAHDQQVTVAEESGAAGRVLRSARARLALTRTDNLAELAEDAERLVLECDAAIAALERPLMSYLEAWHAADARWKTLTDAIRARIETADRERGVDRDTGTVRSEAAMPEPPISTATVRAILRTVPRPRAMDPDYDPSNPAPAEVETEPSPFVFDSDLIPQA